jgi:hypothetical protein
MQTKIYLDREKLRNARGGSIRIMEIGEMENGGAAM